MMMCLQACVEPTTLRCSATLLHTRRASDVTTRWSRLVMLLNARFPSFPFLRTWNRRRHHTNEIFLHECEMGNTYGNEHQPQRITRGCLSRAESGDACETDSQKRGRRDES